MAERRMFAKTIIDSDSFLEMPVTARLLYYDLSMRADDDGFINKPKAIMRMVGASEDDLRILAARKFVIPFESGVVVIKHWRIHNYIRKDTYHTTKYVDELEQLSIKDNGAYTLRDETVTEPLRICDEPFTQDRLGKDSIDKDSIGKDKETSKRKAKPEEKTYSDDTELNETILSFIAFRKTIKKPMSERAIDLLLSKLNSMTADVQEQIAIINQSILNGWQSIYPLKDDKATQKPQKGRLDWIDDL